MTLERSALLLARMRAEGAVSTVEVAGTDLASAAARVGRRVVRIDTTVRLGWADGHEPDPEGPATARLSAFPTGVLTAVLALAWPDSSEDPYPGEVLPVDALDQIASILDRDPKVISKYLAELRAAELVAEDENGRLRLGPAVATWSQRMVTALRRHHHLFLAARSGMR